MAGIKTIIGLSFVCLPPAHIHALLLQHVPWLTLSLQVLAIGFLLVILSAALFKNYLTLLVVATYVVAPLPNWLCGRAANHDDFMESGGNGIVDFGRFLTGFFVVMGIGTSGQALDKRCVGKRGDSSRYRSSYFKAIV